MLRLAGERGEDMPPNPWGEERGGARGQELCKKSLDDENVVMFDYKAQNYRTLMNEDWAIGIFNVRRRIFHRQSPVNLN